MDPRWLGRIVEAGLVPVPTLEPLRYDDVPEGLALLGRGSDAGGNGWLVAFSPRSGGDAVLGAAVALLRCAEEARSGRLRAVAVAPAFDANAQRRWASLSGLPAALGLVVAPALGEGEPGPSGAELLPLPVERVAAHLPGAAERALFEATVAALRGLAAKHGGAVRGIGRSVELVVLARRVAALYAEERRLALEILFPERQRLELSEATLPDALDRLEGFIRKRLNDRKIRDGEEGLRVRLAPALVRASGARFTEPWPLGGSDEEVVDWVGVDGEGRPLLAVVRSRLGVADVGAILDAAGRLAPALPALLSPAGPPVRLEAPRLLIAAETRDGAAELLLGHLAWAVELFEARAAGVSPLGSPRPSGPSESSARPAEVRTPAPSRSDRGRPESFAPLEAEVRPTPAAPRPRDEEAQSDEEEGGAEEAEAGTGSLLRDGRRRRRRGRGRRRGPADETRAEGGEAAPESAARGTIEGSAPSPAAAPRFEEVSLFDLDDDEFRARGETGDDSASRRGRGRRRGRRRRQGSEGSRTPEAGGGAGEDDEVDEASLVERAGPGEPDEDGEEITPLAADVPEIEEDVEDRYDQEELAEQPLTEGERMRIERERRRLARLAKASPLLEAEEEPSREGAAEPEPRLPRGRAAIIAHADRDAVLAAVLLARDVRQVEGIWIYPQGELMTFFRSVATDLRDSVSIYVLGFTASPARDVLQAASLYRGRLVWFDHHVWPPEDLEGLRQAIGPGYVHLVPGTESVLPVVLSHCNRRSRFTDKLVDLATGRFTEHDFERWGRLWWSRLGGAAGRSGERRADLDLLIQGRPSDLSREAGRVPPPPPPEEVAWVESRDFRLVHFGGQSLAVVQVPQAMDLHLVARLARERYGASLSLGGREGSDLFALGTDDAGGRRSLDVGAMADHLAEKFEWVESLAAEDHVARVHIAGASADPTRVDEVIGEIAMGRSILEG